MKRTIRKYYTLNREEAELLKKKAKKACRSEAGLVRELVRGYSPREKPGLEFYAQAHTHFNPIIWRNGWFALIL